MITFDELEKAEVSDLSVKTRVEAFYKGTDAVSKFAEKVMIPVLKGQLDLNIKERAIVDTYCRMYAWVRSMVAMNSYIHFQGAAAATRSLFELLLDIKMLVNDETGELIKKFHAFPDIDKFNRAKKIVSFCDEHRNNTQINDSIQRTFVNYVGRKQKNEKTILRYWGKNKKGDPKRPKHWTGENVRERACSLGLKYEELYVEIYSLLSWYIHSGSTGYVGLKEKDIENCFGYCHGLAQRMFIEATVICAKEMKLDVAVEWFYKAIENLRLTPGKVLVGEQIKFLEEKARAS